MKKYIPLDALVADIKKIRAKWFGINNDFADGQKGALTDVLSLINTLQVKEVDLDAEVEDYIENTSFVTYDLEDCDIKMTAKHFFELGMLSTITEEDCKLIWNIGDSLPYMPEEDFFKELLRRYKAQKGS